MTREMNSNIFDFAWHIFLVLSNWNEIDCETPMKGSSTQHMKMAAHSPWNKVQNMTQMEQMEQNKAKTKQNQAPKHDFK